MTEKLFSYDAPFLLESGTSLPGFQVSYCEYGADAHAAKPVIWVCHALTANAQVHDWWPGLFGSGKLLDPARYRIICANMLGSCYGSTHALSMRPGTAEPWYHDFPLLTNRDIVSAFDILRQYLEIDQVYMLIGGSMGGQQCIEWAIQQPTAFERLVPMATNARHSPWGIAFNESQRMAIAADQSWLERHPAAGKKGLAAARSIALLSYRGYNTYADSQMEDALDTKLEGYRATTYQQYQGDKLVRRFNAFAYWTLSQAMDNHHVGRGRGGLALALAQITARTLVLGVNSDLLFPVEEQRLLAEKIPHAQYAEVMSRYGHDGFLIETEQLEQYIAPFLAN